MAVVFERLRASTAARIRGETTGLAKIGGALYLAGGVLAVLAQLLPHPPASDQQALIILDAVALAAGAALLFLANRVRQWMIHPVLAAAPVLICLALYFSGTVAVYGSMFVWIAAFAGLFLSRRAAFTHLAWLMACYAVALEAIGDSAGYSPVTRVLLTGIALGVVVTLTSWLVGSRRLADERAQRFFDLSSDLLGTINRDGYFVELNDAWTGLLGWSADELCSRPYIEFVHPDDRERTRSEGAALLEGRETDGFENRNRAKDGTWHWLSWSSSRSADTDLVYARATDVTEAKQFAAEREVLVKEFETMAMTDALTGVPNRRWLDDELHREMERASRGDRTIGLAILDLDHFKNFNDTEGHIAGDEYLRYAVQEWRRVLRAGDFIARYGGEEFVVLFPAASAEQAEQIAERIRSATPAPLTASAGVAYWDGGEEAKGLIESADSALYTAKKLGRDRTVIAGPDGARIPLGTPIA